MDSLKINLTLNSKNAIEVYQQIKGKRKALAIEQALMLLYKDKKYKDLFFDKEKIAKEAKAKVKIPDKEKSEKKSEKTSFSEW